ncbi:unnamed protein product [Cyprideis torosa]|uniref:ATP-dependent RNA helicase n=1 Tax=Cyprideis torosa TaxID=163714 RepID=A0A7R8W945_9CRUS|nr:unnamed protein product [Cyprideis torosa]CAG0883927.1 unnamed protein product [Cyprideis torosa]
MGVARKRRKNSSKKSSLSWKAVEVGDGTTPLQMTAQDWSSFGALEELADYSLTKKNGVVVVENAGQASTCRNEEDSGSGDEKLPSDFVRGCAGSSEDEEQESCRSEESDEEDDDSEDCDASSEGSGGSDGGFEDAEDSDGSVEDKEDHRDSDEDVEENEDTDDSDEDVEENENTDDSDEDVEDKDEENSDGSDENDPVTKAMKFLDERNRRTDQKSIPKDIDMTAWGAYSLPREILNGLRDSCFKEPTPIQSLTLGAAISEKKDIIGAAETGSGKTLAFGLPILGGLVREGKTAGVDALILTPTRELALQIKNHILQVAKYTHVKVACIVGGLSKEKQERVLKKPPQILVATPGRLWEMIQEGNAALQRLPDIKMAESDGEDDVKRIVIHQVRQYKCLFDPTDKGYQNRVKSDLAWEAIAKEVGISKDEAKSKWHSARNYLVTNRAKLACRKCPSGSGASEKKEVKVWDYYSDMEFMLPYVGQSRNGSSSLKKVKLGQAVDEAVASALGGDETEDEFFPFSPPSSVSTTTARSEASTPTPQSEASTQTPRSGASTTKPPKPSASALDRYVDYITNKEPEHSEVQWFRSLTPQLDMLDPISLLQFKTEVQTLLCRYLKPPSQGTQGPGPSNYQNEQQFHQQQFPQQQFPQQQFPQGATADYTPGKSYFSFPHRRQIQDFSLLIDPPSLCSRYLVIDEADRMTERGHFEELESIIQFIRSEDQAGEEGEPRTAKKRQTFLFSATLTLLHSPPEWLKRKKRKRANMTVKKKLSSLLELVGMEKQPKLVDLSQKQGTAEKLKEAMVPCKTTEKDHLLYYFLHKFPGRTLVFCNSIDCVRRLKNIFEFLQTDPLPLHANMHQKQRLKNLERFSSSQTGFLLASDVAARGLDIPNVQHVIHYQVPRTSEAVTQSNCSIFVVSELCASKWKNSSSNTFGNFSCVRRPIRDILLPKDMQHSPEMLITNILTPSSALCLSLPAAKELPIFPIDPILLSKARERVQIARELDKISHSMRKSKAERDWMKRNADEMELLLSSDGDSDGSEEETGREFGRKNKRVEALKAQLKDLLKTPLTQEIHRKYLMPGDGELMGNGSLANSRISDQGGEGAAVAALDQELKEQDRLKQSLKKRKSSAWCKKRKKKRKAE